MFDWVTIGILALRLANGILEYAKGKQQFNAGHEAAILEQSKKTMAMTAEGKRLQEKIDAMGEGELDDLESQLTEPDTGKG